MYKPPTGRGMIVSWIGSADMRIIFLAEAGALGHKGTHVDEPLFCYRRHSHSKLAAARRVFPSLHVHDGKDEEIIWC